MLRLATVFSGIGAIEHALQRMEIDHKIVFACDNGDVDILSKKISMNLDEIENEFYSLNLIITSINMGNDSSEQKLKLVKDLTKLQKNYNMLKDSIMFFEIDHLKEPIYQILIEIVCNIKKNYAKYKKYQNYLRDLEKSNSINNKFLNMKIVLDILNDFKKDYDINLLKDPNKNIFQLEENKSDSLPWLKIISNLSNCYQLIDISEAKKLVNSIRDVCERLSMLHERINSFHILERLNTINTYKDKKKYIDSLYEGKDKQNKVKQSYINNYDIDPENFHWNVSFLDGKQYENDVDLFVGGSPCQSFSLVGKQRGLEDTRGTLFYEYARLVSEIKPKVFIYENVKALLSNDEGNTWKTIQKIFTDLNYVWFSDVLNAKDYGIPQNRERVFVVGFRKDLVLNNKFEFPTPIPLKKHMKDFLLDNVSGKYYLNKKGVEFVTCEKNINKRYTQIDGLIQLCQKKNQQFNWHGDFVFEEYTNDKNKAIKDLEKYFLSEKVLKYVLSSGTKGFYSKPNTDLDIARPLLTTMHKMHRAGIDNYVTTMGKLRKLTPRECLRLMGFCDSFKIVVSDTAMYQQAGNSIVVDVLVYLMDKILYSYPKLIE